MNKGGIFIGAVLLCAGMFASMQYINCYNEKPIVVVIPSYNNSLWYEKNLSSVFGQKYNNYRVIYIDDASQDGTPELVENYIKKYNQSHRVMFIKNTQNQGAMANHYTAVSLCADYEIVVHLDGDDWFKHDHVLSRVNQEYQNPQVWLTYGQYEMDPPEYPGICRELPQWVIDQNAYRNVQWVTSHVRTFYAGLFKKIKKEDLMYQGAFLPVNCDLAMMFPMLEMAAGRIKFIPDVLYVYNNHNALNDYKVRFEQQMYLTHFIRNKQKYTKIASL